MCNGLGSRHSTSSGVREGKGQNRAVGLGSVQSHSGPRGEALGGTLHCSHPQQEATEPRFATLY